MGDPRIREKLLAKRKRAQAAVSVVSKEPQEKPKKSRKRYSFMVDPDQSQETDVSLRTLLQKEV